MEVFGPSRTSWRFKKNRVLNDKTITLPDNKMIEFYVTKKEFYADLKIPFFIPFLYFQLFNSQDLIDKSSLLPLHISL